MSGELCYSGAVHEIIRMQVKRLRHQKGENVISVVFGVRLLGLFTGKTQQLFTTLYNCSKQKSISHPKSGI